MSRFTDPFLFGALFLLSASAWAIMGWQGAIPLTAEGAIAPMTVAVVIVIATPALLFVTVLAFIRALFKVAPKPFWGWMTGATALAAGSIAVANIITMQQSLELGFSTGVWFLAIASLASLIALILALTGAIPSTEHSGVVAPVASAKQASESFTTTDEAVDPGLTPVTPLEDTSAASVLSAESGGFARGEPWNAPSMAGGNENDFATSPPLTASDPDGYSVTQNKETSS